MAVGSRETVLYRDGVVADAAALSAFARQTFIDSFAPLYPPADLEAFLREAYSPALQAAELADPRCPHRLAERAGALIGFAKLRPMSLPFDTKGRAVAELHRLYLDGTAKGLGVADALMDWVIAVARDAGARDVFLGVYSENPRAIRFYRRHGFEKVGEYDFPVGAIMDREWIMRREL